MSEKKKIRILIADDDDLFLHITRNLMLEEGYTIFTASSGAEALKMAVTIKPDLIILDSNMPHASGEELCKIIKHSKNLPSIPIVIVSGREDEKSLREFASCECDDYFPKSKLVSNFSKVFKNKIQKALALL